MDYAPVIVFVYNRINHFKRTLDALSNNEIAKSSPLFIFSDGPKNDNDIDKVKNVRSYISRIDRSQFASIEVFESETNKGLAKSVINGVTKIISQYGKAIIVEDDVITSNDFLVFMNNALEFYKDDGRIWSIGGYTVPIKVPEEYKHDVILTQRVSSYCWATWKDRWGKIDWDISDYGKFRFNFIIRKSFNRYGNDRSSMLDDQMNHRIDSWAIRFDYAMWKNNMFNIVPVKSRAVNIGHDGSGTHYVKTKKDPFDLEIIELDNPIKLEHVEENSKIRKEFVKPFKINIFSLAKRFIQNSFFHIPGKGK